MRDGSSVFACGCVEKEELELHGIEVNDATPSTNDAEAWGVPERETRASSRKLDVCSISSRTIPCS